MRIVSIRQVGLPDHMLRTRWVPARLAPGYDGRKVKRLRRDLHALDICFNPDGSPHSVKVALLRDHPTLAFLDGLPHVPRAVKAIYRKSVRLGHEKATDAFPVIAAMNAARAAWASYVKAVA